MPEKTVQKELGKKPAPSKKQKPQQEVVVQISLSELHPFPDHPFQVREDASMQETAESVKEYGVLVPALARPREDGGYELIAGHRRKHACELAGLTTIIHYPAWFPEWYKFVTKVVALVFQMCWMQITECKWESDADWRD